MQTAHSFTAEKTSEESQPYDQVTFQLVETRVESNSSRTTYFTDIIGTKSCRIDKTGKIVASYNQNGSVMFEGASFDPEDEELFNEVIAVCMDSIIATNTRAIEETAGKSYKTVQKMENITVDSMPNTEYILYSFLGKPFVILGSSAWNLIKCLGYAFYNAAGGYSITTGTLPDGMSPWKMPSIKTAQQKFETGKAKNAIEHYPEYHVPFTDNKITVDTTNQESAATFIADNVTKVEENTLIWDNKLSVGRSASADAEYTAGVVGLLGTLITIPISAVSWVGGAAMGIMSQMQR